MRIICESLRANKLIRQLYGKSPLFLQRYISKINRCLYLRELKRKDTIKLNLGCGYDIKLDYINIDKYNPCADLKMEAHNLSKFKDNYAQEIYAKYVLEHLSRNIRVLKEWYRVLRPGGKLIVRVPNFELYLREYLEGDVDYKMGTNEDSEGRVGWGITSIFGYDKEGMYHVNGFTPEVLRRTLEEAGFKITKCVIVPNLFKDFQYRENADIYCEAIK